MSGISAYIPDDEVRRFSGLMQSMADMTGREAPIVARNTARDFTFAALRITPIAPVRDRTAMQDGRYWVRIYHRFTGRMVRFLGTKDQAREALIQRGIVGEPGRVRNRGFAKSAWIGCLRKLGVSARGSKGAKRTGEDNLNEVLQSAARDTAYVEVANQTPMIERLDRGGPHNPPHHILSRATQATITKMAATLQKLAVKQERQWRR